MAMLPGSTPAIAPRRISPGTEQIHGRAFVAAGNGGAAHRGTSDVLHDTVVSIARLLVRLGQIEPGALLLLGERSLRRARAAARAAPAVIEALLRGAQPLRGLVWRRAASVCGEGRLHGVEVFFRRRSRDVGQRALVLRPGVEDAAAVGGVGGLGVAPPADLGAAQLVERDLFGLGTGFGFVIGLRIHASSYL